jgi:ADP-heptose:LPS heptosyltransferase
MNSMARDKSSCDSADVAARACLVRFGWKRLLLSRLLEMMLLPLVRVRRVPQSENETEPRSILVVEYWYIGDFVMLTPFLKNLRLHYPGAYITLLASPQIAPLLAGQNLVDELIMVSVPWAQNMSRWKKYFSRHWLDFFRCIRTLRSRRFDWGFTARADVRENLLIWIAGVKRRVGYGFGYGRSLLTDIATPDLKRPHYSDRWLRLIEHIGKPVFDRRPELKVTSAEREAAWELLTGLGIKKHDTLVGVHAGARNPVRQWGEQNFLDVAERLAESFQAKVLWFHEPGTPEPASRPGVIPIASPLGEFLAVASQCRVFVCNDTGPMHLATALGVPVVAVFGPGMAAWWGPRSAGSKVVLHEGVWCRPCFDYCIFEQPHCLRIIGVEEVFKASAEALGALLRRTSLAKGA